MSSGITIVPMEDWITLTTPLTTSLKLPIRTVVLSLLDRKFEPCNSYQECVRRMREINEYYIKEEECPVIPFSFVVGNDGNVYEGRGWQQKPEKSENIPELKHWMLDVAVLGAFAPDKNVSDSALELAKSFVKTCVENEFIDVDYTLVFNMVVRRTKMNPKRKKRNFKFYRNSPQVEEPVRDYGVPQMGYEGWSKTESPVTAVMSNVFDTVIITMLHDQYPRCTTGDECTQIWRNIEQHWLTKKIKTTPYSFLVGNDGVMYEGRGFMQPPLKAMENPGLGTAVLDIGITGSYADPEKSLLSVDLVKKFMSENQQVGMIKKKAKLKYYEETTNTYTDDVPPHLMAIVTRPVKKTAFN